MVGIDTVTKESLRGERLPPGVSGSVTVHSPFICKKRISNSAVFSYSAFTVYSGDKNSANKWSLQKNLKRVRQSFAWFKVSIQPNTGNSIIDKKGCSVMLIEDYSHKYGFGKSYLWCHKTITVSPILLRLQKSLNIEQVFSKIKTILLSQTKGIRQILLQKQIVFI